jgi:hypothetical protein
MRPAESPPEQRQRVDWVAVGVFYIVACGVSWPFFWWRDMATRSWEAWGAPEILKTMSIIWGPSLGALVALALFGRRHRQRITLLGSSPRYSLLFYLGPLVLLSILGGRSVDGVPPHLVGVYAALVSMLSIMGEELGWRGFLQDALRPLARPLRYALIGIMWELWHFTNRSHGRPLLGVLLTLGISYPALIALSWIIGEAVERSRSLLVAHTIHLWIDLVADSPSWQAFVTAAVAVALWIILLLRWPQKPESLHSAGEPGVAPAAPPLRQ